MDTFDTFRAAAAIAIICLVVLTCFAAVLFFQHEADRDAAISSQPATITCPSGKIVRSDEPCP